MARKNVRSSKAKKPQPSLIERFKNAPVNRQRRIVLQAAIGGTVLIGGGAALAEYDRRQRNLHDLSVIGEGTPVVVQVHDPSCPKCRSLKLRTQSILEDYPEGSVLYRLADVTTPYGKALQAEYNSPTVTLLMFDGKGKHQGTVQGVQEREDIVAVLERLFFTDS